MKAVVFSRYGEPEVLSYQDHADPRPRTDQILIEIKAAAMNHLDLWIRRGTPPSKFPMIPGSDGAGIVIETGHGTSRFKAGDNVLIQPLTYCGACSACRKGKENFCRSFGILGESEPGTNCQLLAIEERYLRPLPAGLNFQSGAAFPLAGETAYMMLMLRAKLQAGETVLIWGASSGIGHLAIQIAKVTGATVITTIGDEAKRAFAESCGADLVLNYRTDSIKDSIKDFTSGKGVDVVFEHVGAATWDTSVRVLGLGGRIVTCGATTGPAATFDIRHLFYKQQSILGSTMGNVAAFEAVYQLVAEERIHAHVDRVFPMSNIHEAHAYLESGQQMGKVILEPDA